MSAAQTWVCPRCRGYVYQPPWRYEEPYCLMCGWRAHRMCRACGRPLDDRPMGQDCCRPCAIILSSMRAGRGGRTSERVFGFVLVMAFAQGGNP